MTQMVLPVREWDSMYVLVRAGEDPGFSAKMAIGHTDVMSTTLRYLHQEHNTADLDINALFDTPATVKVASTSANDTNAAGTGARSVRITGYDSSGDPLTEDINLAGTSEQTTTGTFAFVEEVKVLTAGSTGSNEGVIWVGNGTFTAGVPATKYQSMEIGTNLSAGGSVFIPNNQLVMPVHFSIAISDTSKNVEVRFTTYDGTLVYEIYDAHFTGLANIEQDINAYPGLIGPQILGLQAKVNTASAVLTTSIALILKEQ